MAKKQTFEDAAAELETIIKTLEANDLTLNDAVKNYARGMKLAAFCQKELDKAQAAVDKLVKADGTLEDADLINLGGNTEDEEADEVTDIPSDIDDTEDLAESDDADFPTDDDYVAFNEDEDDE